MESLVTSRIDSCLKDRVVGILKDQGLTTSDAIRQMFKQVDANNDVSFLKNEQVNARYAKEKIESLDSIYVHGFEDITDEELRAMRIEERHASSAGH